MIRFLLCSLAACLLSLPALQAQEELLPDVTVRESDLQDWDVVTDGEQVLLRLATGTPNVGDGPVHVIGLLPANDDGTQNVAQRIYRTDGSYYERSAGRFEFHVGHDHFHLEDWASFRLREVLPDGGVGDIIVASEKTSFCLIDSEVHDSSLPGFPATRAYRSCGQSFQGISVGWVDVYGKELIGQNLDVKNVPKGTYWLETEVDPENHILEKEENNNIARILITLGDPAFMNGPLVVRPTDAHVDGHDHPDLRIGRSRNPNSHIGNDIYEPTGGIGSGHHHLSPDPTNYKQVLRITKKKFRRANFYSSLQNESAESRTYIIQCLGGRTRKMKIRHYDTSTGRARNVTAAVSSAGMLATMGVDELKSFRSKAGLSRKMKKRFKRNRRPRKKVRGTLRFKAWNADRVDQAWIYLKFK